MGRGILIPQSIWLDKNMDESSVFLVFLGERLQNVCVYVLKVTGVCV